MKFSRIHVNREEMFSLGVEETSGQFYVSFPVSSGFADYEEYYAIDAHMFERFQHDLPSALQFVNRCRRRELDELLMQKPGSNRGSAI
ncbi:hypothetical protein OKW98_17615 [Pseudomonas sp. KU26590]|uniref:hypothetical protein n=1 Tax=Pseudomonas sp. KU26590 TaxID=2991051 RepID=UPI00223DB2EE|nr:hypothetical protein [Pseudomonas sp. KU26590]UZJ58409.1 hypothetical protein OKW98_17615 [Pseudomonas sp. KU26590]